MGRIGPLGIWELLIVLLVVLLILGPRRLPEMAKGIGQAVREFRKGIHDGDGDSSPDADHASAEMRKANEAASKPAEQSV